MFDQLFSFFAILTGVIGIFVTTLILFSYQSNILVNLHLVIIFSLISFRFMALGIGIFFNEQFLDFNFGVFNAFYLIIIPSFYLYFKSLFNDYKQLHYKDLFHAIFPLLMVVLSFVQQYVPAFNSIFVGTFKLVIIILYVVVYLTVTFTLVYHTFWSTNPKELISNRHHIIINNWVRFIFIISMFLFLRLLVALVLEGAIDARSWNGESYSLISMFLWLILYGKILSNPEILYGLPKLEQRLSVYTVAVVVNTSVWNLSTPEITNAQDLTLQGHIDEKIKSYIVEIENFISDGHAFRNPNFSIKDMSKSLHIPSSHLAYIFKYHCKMPFVEFKKYCRIQDGLKFIKAGYLDTMTFEALAIHVGFNSYNSFFVAFKKETGLAPKDFVGR